MKLKLCRRNRRPALKAEVDSLIIYCLLYYIQLPERIKQKWYRGNQAVSVRPNRAETAFYFLHHIIG